MNSLIHRFYSIYENVNKQFSNSIEHPRINFQQEAYTIEYLF